VASNDIFVDPDPPVSLRPSPMPPPQFGAPRALPLMHMALLLQGGVPMTQLVAVTPSS
jgi:hypothetical protein